MLRRNRYSVHVLAQIKLRDKKTFESGGNQLFERVRLFKPTCLYRHWGWFWKGRKVASQDKKWFNFIPFIKSKACNMKMQNYAFLSSVWSHVFLWILELATFAGVRRVRQTKVYDEIWWLYYQASRLDTFFFFIFARQVVAWIIFIIRYLLLN